MAEQKKAAYWHEPTGSFGNQFIAGES